jgi:hypothetical protein
MADTTTEPKLHARPGRRDASVIQVAATKLLARLRSSHTDWFDDDAGADMLGQVEAALRSAWHGDGYEIAKALEREGWDVNSELVAEVDGGCLDEAYDERLQAWITEHGITPNLAIGAEVAVLEQPAAQGEVTAIDHARGTNTVCVAAWGHVKKGNGTHGRVWPWEVVEGWQASA